MRLSIQITPSQTVKQGGGSFMLWGLVLQVDPQPVVWAGSVSLLENIAGCSKSDMPACVSAETERKGETELISLMKGCFAG